MPEYKNFREAAKRRIEFYKKNSHAHVTGKTPPGGDKKKQKGREL